MPFARDFQLHMRQPRAGAGRALQGCQPAAPCQNNTGFCNTGGTNGGAFATRKGCQSGSVRCECNCYPKTNSAVPSRGPAEQKRDVLCARRAKGPTKARNIGRWMRRSHVEMERATHRSLSEIWADCPTTEGVRESKDFQPRSRDCPSIRDLPERSPRGAETLLQACPAHPSETWSRRCPCVREITTGRRHGH